MERLPKTLTLKRCPCGEEVCNRFGYEEGMFHMGTGFDAPLAQEVKRRYEREPALAHALEALLTAAKDAWRLGEGYDGRDDVITAAENALNR